MSSDAHGKGHDGHGDHDGHGHDGHGHGGGAPHDVPAMFGVAAAILVGVVGFTLQALTGPYGGVPHEEHAAHASHERKSLPAQLTGHADLIFKNARVIVPGYEPATTVVVGGGKILAVGGDELVSRADPNTQVRDLKGKYSLLPGLHDAHGHLLDLGRKILGRDCDLKGSTSLEDVKERVMTFAKLHNLKPGDWLIGQGWDESLWEEYANPDTDLVAKARAAYAAGNVEDGKRLEKEISEKLATRQPGKIPDSTEALDEVSLDNPILLYRTDGHMAWVNHKALELAKIVRDTLNPEGGRVLRDGKGEPTGVLVDAAIGLVATLEPPEKPESIEEDLIAACKACARAGLVEVNDAGVDKPTENALRRLAIEHKLPIRVYAMIGRSGNDLIERLGHTPDVEPLGGRLVVRAIKLYADGALGSHGALMLDPYSDEPGTVGLRRLKVEEIEKATRAALDRGYQVCVHAIGDRANRDVLDTFEKVFADYTKEKGHPPTNVRFRIEHAQVLSSADLARFAKLGVIASMQPTHATTDMRWAEQRIGAERLSGAYAWKSMLKSGAHLAFGSDFPVESENPLLGLYAAVTRQDDSGQPKGGWRPSEKLTPDEALEAFTSGAAYAAFEEHQRGELLPGMDADFTVLSMDPVETLEHEPTRFLGARVMSTWIGGEEVFTAK